MLLRRLQFIGGGGGHTQICISSGLIHPFFQGFVRTAFRY